MAASRSLFLCRPRSFPSLVRPTCMQFTSSGAARHRHPAARSPQRWGLRSRECCLPPNACRPLLRPTSPQKPLERAARRCLFGRKRGEAAESNRASGRRRPRLAQRGPAGMFFDQRFSPPPLVVVNLIERPFLLCRPPWPPCHQTPNPRPQKPASHPVPTDKGNTGPRVPTHPSPALHQPPLA